MTQHILAATSWLNLAGVADLYRDFMAKRQYQKRVNHTIKELSALSNSELKDIGLSRGDIYGVATRSNDNLRGWV